MTLKEINALRKANRVAIDARLKDYQPPADRTPLSPSGVVPRLLNPTERATVVARENAKPVAQGCSGCS